MEAYSLFCADIFKDSGGDLGPKVLTGLTDLDRKRLLLLIGLRLLPRLWLLFLSDLSVRSDLIGLEFSYLEFFLFADGEGDRLSLLL